MPTFAGKPRNTLTDMLSKNKMKFIRSLELKKRRREEHAFVAEGGKTVRELLGRFHCRLLAATPEFFARTPAPEADECLQVTPDELLKASLLCTPQEVLAVFDIPDWPLDEDAPRRSLCLALDGVQDPGNLGTIVRLADWFGIEHVYASPDTADVFNPKAVQATMGAIARVQVHYAPLGALLDRLRDVPVYGTFLDGRNIYHEELSGNGLIVMGNEGKGISQEVAEKVSRRLFVPNYPPGRDTSESLNVAVATAVVCAEFRRRMS